MADRTERLLADLAAKLEATAQLPVERTAARWLGEAQAVATDLLEDQQEVLPGLGRENHERHLVSKRSVPTIK